MVVKRVRKPEMREVDMIRRDAITVLVLASMGLVVRAYAEIVNDDMAVRPQDVVALGDNFEPVRRIGAVETEAVDHEIIGFIPRRQAFGGAAPDRHAAGRRLDAALHARLNAVDFAAMLLAQMRQTPAIGAADLKNACRLNSGLFDQF